MIFKKEFTIFSLLLLSFGPIPIIAGGTEISGLWQEIADTELSQRPLNRTTVPDKYKTFRLDKVGMQELLAAASEEYSRSESSQMVELPMPDGKLARFRFEHSLVVEPGLLKKYPELAATYRAYGVDDPTASARFDMLPSGFHAMILSSNGTTMIDPYAVGDTENYVVYFKNDLPRLDNFKCSVGKKTFEDALLFDPNDAEVRPTAPEIISGTQLRTYRLALAATGEYAAAVGGGTVAGTLAAQVLIMNRVNGIYERDVAIHMNIVANNDLIVYTNSASDPYTNSDGDAMLVQNITNLNTVIQSANYDIGHVFSTGGGGVAYLGVPCTTDKAGGVTGLSNPVGDAFAIDYVAHEMGHQWSADHTFNGTSGSCAGGSRNGPTAYEPGSGVTIMAYAGICGGQNLARNSIDTFHMDSLESIISYSQTSVGNTCSQITPSGNTPPSVAIPGGPTFDIPKQTPFTLTANATDINGDAITYDWQEYDTGAPTTAVPNTDATGARPIFRPYLPTTSPSRTFPSLTYILNNANVPPSTYACAGFTCMTGELLPQVARTMIFQVIARDNRANAGGTSSAQANVVVNGTAGPFAVTSPNTAVTYGGNSSQAITWSVAGTAGVPINVANVKISYSTDGGLTFPTVLLASTPNDGTEAVTIPNVSTTTGRIKVEAVGNIFFDISDVNFSVTAVVSNVSVSGRVLTPTGAGLRNAIVSITDPSGNIRRTTTNSFGVYQFDDVLTGQNYPMTVSSKRYRFPPRTVPVTGSLTDVNFTGEE